MVEAVQPVLPDEEMDKLFRYTMKSQWKEVVEMYKNSPQAHHATITKSEDTALHIAISDGETEFAIQMIKNIDKSNLQIQNARGNTPLHVAAELGNLEVCERIVAKSGIAAVSVRNRGGESPIFLTALHGKYMPFLWLHSLDQDEKHLRRDDGDTILHVAIFKDYFRLAVKIITYYPKFVNYVNIEGLSPLHILASKPNAFRSSTSLGLFERVIYYCLVVDELEEPPVNIEAYRKRARGQKETKEKYPENYETCFSFFKLLIDLPKQLEIRRWGKNLRSYWNKITKKDGKSSSKKDGNSAVSADVENPQKKCTSTSVDEDKGKDKGEHITDDQEVPLEQVSIFQQDLGKLKKRDQDRIYPPNCFIFVLFLKLLMRGFLIILGIGIAKIKEIQGKKQLHLRAKLVMEELVKNTTSYKSYGNTGLQPTGQQAGYTTVAEDNLKETLAKVMEEINVDESESQTSKNQRRNTYGEISKSGPQKDHKGSTSQIKNETILTPILIAATTGAAEMVEKILDEYPVAIQDLDGDGKNALLLAVENRQPVVYNLLRDKKIVKENAFRHVDKNGNSALHLAAQFGKHKPWLIPGSALQMQWEIKWYEYVRDSMPPNFFRLYNKDNETPNDVFVRTHNTLIKDGSEWLTKTSESCSVVAALIATVAFTTSSTVPGGVRSESGTPTLNEKPAFDAFAISSLVALCFSITALVFFLSILTSRYQEKDFASDLPKKLLLGLTSLFASIASMLVSFCAGHIFVLNRELRYVAYPLYAALCFPITFFGLAQLSLYFDLVLAILKKIPQRSYRLFPH